MIVLKGKGVFDGIAIGNLSFYKRATTEITKISVEDPEAECTRLSMGIVNALGELSALREKAAREIGKEQAAIIDAQQMMLMDEELTSSITNIIRTQKVNAEYAISVASEYLSSMFASMPDEYMAARAADVKDVSKRLIKALTESETEVHIGEEQVILAADALLPSEIVQLDKTKILAFVTKEGSVNSHTAIIARTLNIPAIVDIGEILTPEYEGHTVIVDGSTGELYLDPDEATLYTMEEKWEEEQDERERLLSYKGKETITKDGRKIRLYANIGAVEDLDAVEENDAEGIGLFRSEFLFLERSDFPTEDEQFASYKAVALRMGQKRVVIRTLDIGADKKIDYFNLPAEENPALGFRAIRICLMRDDIFKTQLRAILRASAYGNISIMFPMITSVKEVRKIRRVLSECMEELKNADIPYNENIEVGIMIETPASVMISDLLAKEVDFFSIGTNDLTQYVLAIDRQNPNLDVFYDPHHPAVLRMIEIAVKNAHENQIWVGICGELGADKSLTKTFVDMGIDELSVSPTMVLPIRKAVRKISQ